MTSITQLVRFIPDRRQFSKIIGLSILLSALICRGQVVGGLQINFASRLNLSTNVEIVSKIPKSHLKKLPATLEVFRYSGNHRRGFGNPPTQAELLAITDYLTQLYVALSRT